MTNRVLLGKKGSDYGLWVSKPGQNVLTASDDNMLLSTDFQAFQIVASGVINNPSNNTDYNLTIPNLGFTPIVLLGGSHVCAYSFPNATTLRIRVFSNLFSAGGNTISWAVTNQRIRH